jgi:hypothetical protein
MNLAAASALGSVSLVFSWIAVFLDCFGLEIFFFF